MEDKQAIMIMIFIYGLTFFMSLAVVSIPVLLNPNRGLTQGEFLVNEVHLEEMIDDYLRELYNKIEIEMEILRDIAFGKKMQLEDIILNIGLTVKEYNDRVNLIAENNERLNILKPKKEALEKEIKDINNRISEIEREISNERNKEDPDYGKINTLTSNVRKLKNELSEKRKRTAKYRKKNIKCRRRNRNNGNRIGRNTGINK
jgi:chromosome segregation ATPase